MKDDKIINGNCWVAYFDILGFSSMVKDFPVWFVLKEYQKALKRSKSSNIECKFKFFSDSFIFYTSNDSQVSFSRIEGTSSLFFQAMFRGNIPMRGCLNWGQFYADEGNGIFFGPALIEAYKLAEEQNWIGFVLSGRIAEKLGIESGYKNRYREYKVPYKEEPKLRNLLAYNLNLLTTIGKTGQARNQQYQLWKALDYMKYCAIDRCSEYKERIIKYENTEKFIFCVYPELKKMIKSQSKN